MNVFSATQRLRVWVIGLFIKAINGVSKEEDRAEVLNWLGLAREVVGSDKSKKDKFIELYKLLDAKKAAKIAFNGVAEGVRNYKNADLPWGAKVTVPVTLLASPFLFGHGVGVAALGGAVGLPALLLLFIGTAGITTIIEACTKSELARSCIGGVASLIIASEVKRQVSEALKKAMEEAREEPFRFDMPDNEAARRQRLLKMDPFDFEKHVMSFFSKAGMEAKATQKTNDAGVDGFAKHPGGIIVVQCKRYAPDNFVSRPDIQKFKGAIEDSGAFKGYFVTTSGFTKNAEECASKSAKIILVAMDEFVRWHDVAPDFMDIQ